MEEIRIKTKEVLDKVEKAPDGSFLTSVRSFVKFAQQQRESFSKILVEELEHNIKRLSTEKTSRMPLNTP